MEAPRDYLLRYVMIRMAILATTAVLGCESPGTSQTAHTNTTLESPRAVPHSGMTASDNFVGVVVGRYSADLTPRFDGKVRDVHVRLGDRVHKGDLLATLDLPTVQSELRVAEMELRSVDIERERTAVELAEANDYLSRRVALGREALATTEDISTARYKQQIAAIRLEATRAASAEKRARIAQLRKDVDTAELRAPFDGLISARYVDPGASITMTTHIVRLITDDDLLVRFAVPESSLNRLAIGLSIEAFIGDQNIQLRGKIEKIAPEIDVASRMVVVEARLEGQKISGAVIAGLMAHVTLSGR